MLVNEAADANELPNEANKLRHDLRNLPQGKRIVMNQPLILGQILTLMLQSPNHRHYSLSDLEWMVLPPLKFGQVAMAETKPDQSGSSLPMAVVFWASVSPEVDRRISSNLSAPIRLRPDEWRSGDILWIADMVGDMSAGHALVKNVLESVLPGRTLRVRSLDGEGRPILLEVGASSISVVATTGPETCAQSGACSTGMLCASCVTTGCTGRCRTGKAASSNSVNH
jgi:hemolysin-activating ACP:hemolysin acyltransferase